MGWFFIGTFVVTWALQLPAVLIQAQGGSVEAYLPLAMLGVLGPAVVATGLSAREAGLRGVRALYAPLLRWRVHPLWYGVALVLPGAALTTVLYLLREAGWSGPIAFLPALGQVVAAVVIALGEEVGWRGYALPRLQRRYGAFGASGLIAMAWTLWHIPMFIGLGVPLELLLVMFLHFAGGSLVFTWVYNGTGGSLLLVVLAHVGAHLNNSHAALPAETLPAVVHAVVYAVIGYAALAPATLRHRMKRLDGRVMN